jgi:hypothetical protein
MDAKLTQKGVIALFQPWEYPEYPRNLIEGAQRAEKKELIRQQLTRLKGKKSGPNAVRPRLGKNSSYGYEQINLYELNTSESMRARLKPHTRQQACKIEGGIAQVEDLQLSISESLQSVIKDLHDIDWLTVEELHLMTNTLISSIGVHFYQIKEHMLNVKNLTPFEREKVILLCLETMKGIKAKVIEYLYIRYQSDLS